MQYDGTECISGVRDLCRWRPQACGARGVHTAPIVRGLLVERVNAPEAFLTSY